MRIIWYSTPSCLDKNNAFSCFSKDWFSEARAEISEYDDTKLVKYITDYCENNGRAFSPIQNGMVIDCLTDKILWKI